MDITEINPQWEKGIFSHVTGNLLEKGYLAISEGYNINNLLDLLNQSNQIVKKASKNFTEPDTLFSGSIELPDGSQQKIFIAQNELGKFTIMLPEDY